ncbi:MAG TPA: PIN domain-containing protein [Longimicrobium sp.]|jgi:predicted nucleic acid-binding protein|nr:PIN domain-containing protein [Longimicrobium sp.]
MILTDTSVLIEFARKPTLPVAQVVVSGKPAVCGVVVAELYTGLQTEAQRPDLDALLRLFGRVPIDEPVWKITGRVMGAMTRRGTKIKFPDAVIAATAIHRKLPLWTRDAHFTWVQSAFPELKLFDERAA